MTAHTARRLAGWKEGDVLDMHAEMMTLTQVIVAKTLFDADVADESYAIAQTSNILAAEFGNRLRSVVQFIPAWLPTPGNLRAGRALRHLDEVVYRMVAARRQTGEDRGDLLSMLLQAKDADDGSRMSNEQVRDEVMTLFMAGHETTAVTLSWTWYLLARHLEVDARLADELQTVLDGRPPTVADLPRLPLAEMIINESMRLYPPAYALARQAVNPSEIAGHPVAPGLVVIMPAWIVQRKL